MVENLYQRVVKLWGSKVNWVLIIILWAAYGLMVSSMAQKSATVDEQSHLFRGAAYLKAGATHFLLGHPMLGSMIAALPLLTEPDLQLPTETAAWAEGNWSTAGHLFMWELNDNPQRLLFLGRTPIIWLTLILASLLYRWGYQLADRRVGLVAASLFLFDPNLLAHGRLITGDLPVTFFFVVAAYGYWRLLKVPEQSRFSAYVPAILLTGCGMGLASATKFNAGLLVPILGVAGLIMVLKRRDIRPLWYLFVAGLVAWGAVWVVYGFAWRPLPGGSFWDDLFWELRYFDKPHGSYLAGNISTTGWWYYFPVAFMIKTPIPLLLLLVAGVVQWGRQWRQGNVAGLDLPAHLCLLSPPIVYFIFCLTSSLNIGYRYMLPMLPFLWLFTAIYLFAPGMKRLAYQQVVQAGAGGLIVVLIGLSVGQWPDYIPFFNQLVGEEGWHILADSNVDWGQDLPALAEWQAEHGGDLQLSYFGTAAPSAYGIDFKPLPTWSPAPEQGLPQYQPFWPAQPAPGLYGISVTNLQGVVLGSEPETYAWFRDKEPLARIGGSIFIYEVAASGEPVDMVLAGLTPAELEGELV
ncbi:MAG TPA: phospholipid carrier-dependent glycosyltransferase, partial [Anaerolineae bacterium]|nr:phospholipid carrier-dependent glycosyltransferase [Anaerolineae bacterium]